MNPQMDDTVRGPLLDRFLFAPIANLPNHLAVMAKSGLAKKVIQEPVAINALISTSE